MPELPEVETIRRGLSKRLIGQKIKSITVLEKKSFQIADEDRIWLEESVIKSVRRRAKVLMIDLDSDYTLLFHLKMTGQLIYREPNSELTDNRNFAAGHPTGDWLMDLPNKSTRVYFEFEDASKLFFNDQRKFGWIKLLPTEKVMEQKFLHELGPEIVDFTQDKIPEKISESTYKQVLSAIRRHNNAPIKAVILDQKVVAGIGNIYADEGLWGAKIHPATVVKDLTDRELRKLLREVKASMTRSIESGGSTMQTFVKADGTKGNYLDLFANVFRREGLPCPRCQTEIIKIRVAGRGTHICPKCQIKH
ncbi:MAG: bifunctional DNA-formamidopyrimidine glycosylase/DNA-(apurinic or apyrimidinic site) lyase [Streptococcaceae bacterium]|jgi:formamidopyrimidine-DNA glycosylase|nr:bifunctional DNA-formamidopyrimidine glycosylase/DNA-(apurinic or apyrimidinic site) lyase [Streptococcaceae bacterium]